MSLMRIGQVGAWAAARGHRVRRSRWGLLGWVSFAVIGLGLVVAVAGPLLTSQDPNDSDLSRSFMAPAPGHPLGFDSQGRDLLARLLVGTRSSLLGPLGVVVLSMGVATMVAIACAWLGGWFDSFVSATLEVMFAFPGILLAILAAAVFGPGLRTAVLALSVAYVPYAARLLRSTALSERRKPYVQALEIQGASATAICLRHLVPNMLPLITAQATLLFGYAMVDLAILSYFGLGVQFPDADWGVMVGSGQTGVLQGYPAESLLAGFLIVALVVSFNVVGERMSAAVPRRRARRFPGLLLPRRDG